MQSPAERHGPGFSMYDLRGAEGGAKDPTQEVEGRTVTFHVNDDRVLVDGQEQVRTLSVIRNRKESPKP